MNLRGLRPSPLELPAHPHSPRRNQYTPPVVEVAGIEPASEALPTRRNYSHVLNYGGGLADFQQRPSPQDNIFFRKFKFSAVPKPGHESELKRCFEPGKFLGRRLVAGARCDRHFTTTVRFLNLK